jgi:hypothetical protein
MSSAASIRRSSIKPKLKSMRRRKDEKREEYKPSPASPNALPIKSAARASPSAAITFA